MIQQTRLDPRSLGSDGLTAWLHRFTEAVHAEKPIPGATLETASLRAMWEACVGRPEDTLMFARNERGFVDAPIREAGAVAGLGTTVFQKATGELISKRVIQAYDGVPTIGDQLTTNYPTKFKKEDFVGFEAIGDIDTVVEGAVYGETGFGETYVGTDPALKKGVIIALTEETIFMDQTGQIVLRCNQVGQAAARTKEKAILTALTDDDTTNYIYKPQGAAEVLYRTAAGTNSTTVNLVQSNALVSYTDLNAMLQLFAGMVDSENNRIGMPANLKLIVPFALAATAHFVTNAVRIQLNEGGYATSGNPESRQSTNWPMIAGMPVLTSALLDGYSTSTYYLGDPAQQFLWRDIWPLQVSRRGADTEDGWFRDIAVQFKVRYYGGCACIADKYVVQSTA